MTPRYGQLTYTSYDAPGTAGGWQIRQTAGALTATEIDTLVEGVRTVFQPVEPLPAYPTPEDCERGPRRLAYRRIDAETAGYWHTVPAGPDATGRPGNVFAHTVLDRDPDAGGPLRPIQRWRCDRWLRPHGSAAVARADLPAEPPAAGEAVTAASVLAFVMDTDTWRLGTLLGLLDAVAAALHGGPAVVLGVHGAESAAQWIGAVSFLTSPGTAARLGFSTFDRADQVALAVRSGQHLTAVPIADLDAAPADVVIIDETATLSLGELGGEPHRTAGGQHIEVTPWSAMAQVTMLDPHSAGLVIGDIATYAAQADDRGLHPAWPMAMSVANRPEFADARDEAQSIIAAHSPSGVAPDSTIGQTVAGALAAFVGSSTAEAWHAVGRTHDGGAAEHADATYLTRAMTDPAWLAQLGPIPVGPRAWHGREIPAEVSAEIGPALDQAAHAGPERLVRLVDLLWRAGVTDERLHQALIAHRVGAALADAQDGPILAHRLGERIGWSTRLAMVAETLRSAGAPVDGVSPVDDAVLEWLAGDVGVPSPSELAGAAVWDPTWSRAAVRGARAQRFGPATPGDRFAQLWWLRVCESTIFDQLAASAVWDPDELLIAAGGGPLPGTAVLPTLLGAPSSEALNRLADAVGDADDDETAVACAAVRRIEPGALLTRGYLDTRQGGYTARWDEAIDRVGLGLLHRDCGVQLLTLAVLAVVGGRPALRHGDALAADPRTADAAREQVTALVDQHTVSPTAVLAASLLPQATPGGEGGEARPGTAEVVSAVAAQLVTTRDFNEEDVETVVRTMTQWSGAEVADAPTRRYRRMVHGLLARRPDAQGTPAGRIRGSR